jgi:hypothetical protein
MSESPLSLCKKLVEQWHTVLDSVYLDSAEKKDIFSNLADLQNHITVLEQYASQEKTFSGEYAAAEYGLSFMEIPKIIEQLQDHARNSISLCENRPDLIEEANLLMTLTRRCGDNIRVAYKYTDNKNYSLPKTGASRMNTRNNHPQYPIYKEGVLAETDLTDLYNIRDMLQMVRQADIALESISADDLLPAKTLISQAPLASMIVGTESTQSREILEIKLQQAYSTAYNKGVACLSKAFGHDGADSQMAKEVEAIENFFKLPSQVRSL